MFKTILKTLALSAATLTSLSACGTLADLEALNALLHEPIHSGEIPPISAIDTLHDSHLKGYPGLVIDPNACYDCEFLTEEQLDALEADLIARSEEALNNRIDLAKAHLEKTNKYYSENWYGLSVEDQLAEKTRRPDEERRIAALAVSGKADIRSSVKKFIDTAREISIRRASIVAEQARWDASESPRATYEPATTVARMVSVNTTYTEDDAYTTVSTKTDDTFSLVIRGGKAITTINGVNYEFIDKSHAFTDRRDGDVDPTSVGGRFFVEWGDWYTVGSWNISDFDRSNTKAKKAMLFSNPARNANIRDVVNGTHPTVQGDYFGFSDNSNTGFATIGIQTDATVVESQTAVAIYRGEGFLGTYGTPDYDNLYREYAELAITMNVDFNANTIAGTGNRTASDRYGHSERHYGFLDDKVTFNSAPIVGNGFEGTFTLDRSVRANFKLTDNPTGQYSGNFFGPNADDLAGVMSFDGTARQYDEGYGETNDPFAVIGIGGFRADRAVE